MPVLKNEFTCLAGLPSMPALLMEAIQQIDNNQNLKTLVDKICLDPAMAMRILRVANSPFYGMPREIGSLREAVILLGLNRVRDLLVSVFFSKMMPAQHKDFNYRLFWHHSMAVAECTRQLALFTGSSLDFAFTAGLLHDIGRLVIVVLFPDEYSRIIKESVPPDELETERRILGFDNVQLGGMAAHYWNLPVAVQEAIEQHKTPPEWAAVKSLGLLVYTSNLLTVNAGSDESALDDNESIRTALALLNVSYKQAGQCADKGQQFVDQVATLF